MKISEALKKLIENPDDLSTLPQLVAQVEELEGQEENYQDRINKLQEINRNYLAQIPIPNKNEQQADDNKEPTLEEAREHIINAMGGNK